MAWFKSFDIVLNALDNLGTRPTLSSRTGTSLMDSFSLAARRHVNKMCMAGNVPLIESGTAGYLGQVQPILRVRVVFGRLCYSR